MSSPTPNKGYTYPAHGGSVNAWDTPLNTNFDQIDLNLAGYYPVTISSTVATVTYNSSYAIASSTAATITPPSSLAQNLTYVFSGTLTQNTKLVLPSAGGMYQVYNNTSGSFNLTVGTAVSSGSAVTVNQGGGNMVVCYDAANFALSNSNPTAARLYTYLGNPNGSVAGSVGATNAALTDTIWDATNRQLYMTTTGSSAAASTVWSPQLPRLTPGGYLTVSNNTTSPIVTSDTTASTVYYTPLVDNWMFLSNGTLLFPYQFSQMTLSLTATQAASNIYDVFMWWNSGTPVIGCGPSWSAGGGSVSAGSCARGTGAGSTALTRLQGILVNSVQVTLSNGVSTYTCPANEGVYLGSIFMDTSAGNVTCHRSWGGSRKWGVWNYYNRQLIQISMGISTASWSISNASPTFQQSNNDSTATMAGFTGMAEEPIEVEWAQNFLGNTLAGDNQFYNSVALNSVTTVNSYVAKGQSTISGSYTITGSASGSWVLTPSLGMNNFNFVEANGSGSRTCLVYGTQTNMYALLTYRG